MQNCLLIFFFEMTQNVESYIEIYLVLQNILLSPDKQGHKHVDAETQLLSTMSFRHRSMENNKWHMNK